MSGGIRRFLPNPEYQAAINSSAPGALNPFATIADLGGGVEEYANIGAFPVTGETDLIYIAADTNLIYRWDGVGYQAIGGATLGTQYLGLWDANTNTPTIVSSTHAGANGDFYFVGTAGATSIDGITPWAVGDAIIWNGLVWQQLTVAQLVTSVNGYTGAVNLAAADLSDVDATTSAVKQNNFAAVVAPGVNDDSAAGYAIGSTWVNTLLNISWLCVDASVGAALWAQTGIEGDIGRRVDTVSWADGATDYVSKNLTLTYVSQAAFEFKGELEVGNPSRITFVGNGSDGSPAHSVRIYDITNAVVIAEVTGSVNAIRAIVDMGAIANVPSLDAIWEIQAKRDGSGSVALELSSLTIEY